MASTVQMVAAAEVSIAGRWQLVMQTPAGERRPVLTLVDLGQGRYTGTLAISTRDTAKVHDVKLQGQKLSFTADGKLLIPVAFVFEGVVQGDTMSGTTKLFILPRFNFTATRLKNVGVAQAGT